MNIQSEYEYEDLLEDEKERYDYLKLHPDAPCDMDTLTRRWMSIYRFNELYWIEIK